MSAASPSTRDGRRVNVVMSTTVFPRVFRCTIRSSAESISPAGTTLSMIGRRRPLAAGSSSVDIDDRYQARSARTMAGVAASEARRPSGHASRTRRKSTPSELARFRVEGCSDDRVRVDVQTTMRPLFDAQLRASLAYVVLRTEGNRRPPPTGYSSGGPYVDPWRPGVAQVQPPGVPRHLERLADHAHPITIEGESYRSRQRPGRAPQPWHPQPRRRAPRASDAWGKRTREPESRS